MLRLTVAKCKRAIVVINNRNKVIMHGDYGFFGERERIIIWKLSL